MINREDEITSTNLEQFGRTAAELDQEMLLKTIAEMGGNGFALQQRAEQLVQNPEAFLELLSEFENMKGEVLAAITELWSKVNAAGRERLLAAKELLKTVKIVAEIVASDLLQKGKNTLEGIGALLLTPGGRVTLLVVGMLILSACGGVPDPVKTALAPDVAHAQEPSPTPSSVPTEKPTKSPTPKPTRTKTPTPEATKASESGFVTETSVPSDMKELEKLGYADETLDGESMHVVMREGTVKYGEVKWKGKIVQAWTEVGFFIDGEPVRGIVVNQWYDPSTESTYILESSGGITWDPQPLSPAAVRGLREGIAGMTPSESPVVVIKFGSTGNELTDGVFEGAFPLNPFTGDPTDLVNIPGVGKVLPATAILIQGAMTSK